MPTLGTTGARIPEIHYAARFSIYIHSRMSFYIAQLFHFPLSLASQILSLWAYYYSW